MLEFFAGRGNLTTCMRACGWKTAALDILYNGGFPDCNSNPMDINSRSGFASFGSIVYNSTLGVSPKEWLINQMYVYIGDLGLLW